ncbi:hypothetical protein MKZ38_006587 [Zalerion maritima]|uniref:Uncharacterized protein n=1 Tax=Zalerion maritima TaxID=339359 RepID=A0AAD5RIS3_9PEZI|nr:hypothetical protein MKZ38_006587 [Zalerion maritima]
MPFTETVTIINNSGKIISTGKHLVGLFKDAKSAYKEKKAVLEEEKTIQRAYTSYDVPVRSSSSKYHPSPPDGFCYEVEGQSLADDDRVSRASSNRSHRSLKSSRSERTERTPKTRTRSLTVANLDRLSEVSSTAPSKVPKTYRAPYAETVSKSLVLSRPDLARAPTAPAAAAHYRGVYSGALDPQPMCHDAMSVHEPSVYMNRASSEPNLVHDDQKKKKKEIDMNLAYGSMPPDLADRVDLDPNYKPDRETQVQQLVDKIEGILDEAECVHHSANTIISMLQDNPQRAAAVALALAELSSVLGKMTPAFAGIIKSGSPAVFGLLASPQFLIAAGVAVGVTIVMFGGYKIIKRIKESKATQEKLAFDMEKMNVQQAVTPPPVLNMGHVPEADYYYDNPPFGRSHGKTHTEVSHDDAIVLDDAEELSTIESWRRGILPFGSDQSADLELISPEAERVMKQRFRDSRMEFDGDDRTVTADDSVSRAGSKRSHRSHKTSSRRSKSHTGHHRSSRLREEMRSEVPERTSSKDKVRDKDDDARSRHSGHSSHSHRSDRSHRSSRTERTEKKPSTRVAMKAIEDGSKDRDNTLQSILGKDKMSSVASSKATDKEKKAGNMLKTMFKRKKEREDRGGSRLVLEMA